MKVAACLGFAKGCGDGFGDEFCAGGVGMDFVGEQGGFVCEGGVQVDDGCVQFFGDLLEGGDDFGLHDGLVDSPACFVNGDWEADVNGGF